MAAVFSLYPASAYNVGCCLMRESKDLNRQPWMRRSLKINGTYGFEIKVQSLGLTAEVAELAVATATDTMDKVAPINFVAENGLRQRIPSQKQMVDPNRQGLIVEGGVGYKQTVVIRSYEVGPDKTATLEAIFNLFQETALNHVWLSGLLSDGFGATHGMMRNNLIWVVSRMQVQIDYYPIWGEVVEIETWVGASGKNGMRRDWVVTSQHTGQIFARATSTWVMMNRKTRRLSKMPEEVREELSPWFIEKQALIMDQQHPKILKLDTHANYINTDLKPRRSDLDMNQHVNNVKYVRWMLETIPEETLESHQLCGITLEYRRECGSSDIVESLCEAEDEVGIDNDDDDVVKKKQECSNNSNKRVVNGFSCMKPITRYIHLLQTKGDNKRSEEIVRGRTTWKTKLL